MPSSKQDDEGLAHLDSRTSVLSGGRDADYGLYVFIGAKAGFDSGPNGYPGQRAFRVIVQDRARVRSIRGQKAFPALWPQGRHSERASEKHRSRLYRAIPR